MNCYGYNYYKNCYPNPLPEEQVVSGLQGPQGPRGEQGPQGCLLYTSDAADE